MPEVWNCTQSVSSSRTRRPWPSWYQSRIFTRFGVKTMIFVQSTHSTPPHSTFIQTLFTCVYSRRHSAPRSRPKPEALKPPNGMAGS